jgi:formate hydrogenlyase subunit 3/multisubunit Na+/H+ antiporter MnhD subunit
MYHIDSLYNFQRFIDEEGTISFFSGSNDLNDYNFGKFIKFQFIFFCVGALVTIGLMPVRMIISFWRTTNTKDKV